MRNINRLAIALSVAAMAYLPVASAVMVGQLDDFEDGSEMNWTAGGFNPQNPQFPPNPPANVASGGPGGADDNYLLVTGEGGLGGPGSRMTTFNLTQWAGDFTDIDVINMDVNNFAAGTLNLRILFLANDFTSVAVTTASVDLGPGSGWQSVSFAVEDSDLTGLGGADPENVLENTAVMRLFHAPTANFPNAQPTFAGTVGFDNISAVPVPPAIVFLISGIAGLWARGRKAT